MFSTSLVALGVAHDHVAAVLDCSVRRTKPVTIGIPSVLQRHAELLGEERGDLVLEALARLVGERQVGGIGADPEGGARHEIGQLRAAGPAPPSRTAARPSDAPGPQPMQAFSASV